MQTAYTGIFFGKLATSVAPMVSCFLCWRTWEWNVPPPLFILDCTEQTYWCINPTSASHDSYVSIPLLTILMLSLCSWSGLVTCSFQGRGCDCGGAHTEGLRLDFWHFQLKDLGRQMLGNTFLYPKASMNHCWSEEAILGRVIWLLLGKLSTSSGLEEEVSCIL